MQSCFFPVSNRTAHSMRAPTLFFFAATLQWGTRAHACVQQNNARRTRTHAQTMAHFFICIPFHYFAAIHFTSIIT